MERLTLTDLGKTFPGDVRALEGFSLEVGDGELVAVVGPSGCGKSTLLRLIAGLEEESFGTIRLGERVLNGLPPKDRDVAIVFQSYTLLPHLTLAENLGFGLKLRGETRQNRETKVLEIARLLGIESLLGRHPDAVSGGERQRTALGRAILRRPGIFLFDEPLSSLDAQTRLQLRVEIQRLHRRLNTPMLFVTHDQSEALTLGDRVVVLNRGRIQQIATPEELVRHPANTFVAAFIGAPGMNLFPGRPETVGGQVHFRSAALEFSLSPEAASRLGNRAEVIAGIRPEHLVAENPSTRGGLVGEITAVERQAGQICLYLHHGGISFAARLPEAPENAGVGETMGFGFDPARIAFFDAATENLI